jgi:hypothetical protein
MIRPPYGFLRENLIAIAATIAGIAIGTVLFLFASLSVLVFYVSVLLSI